MAFCEKPLDYRNVFTLEGRRTSAAVLSDINAVRQAWTAVYHDKSREPCDYHARGAPYRALCAISEVATRANNIQSSVYVFYSVFRQRLLFGGAWDGADLRDLQKPHDKTYKICGEHRAAVSVARGGGAGGGAARAGIFV